MAGPATPDLLTLTAQIVAAPVAGNRVAPCEVPGLIHDDEALCNGIPSEVRRATPRPSSQTAPRPGRVYLCRMPRHKGHGR